MGINAHRTSVRAMSTNPTPIEAVGPTDSASRPINCGRDTNTNPPVTMRTMPHWTHFFAVASMVPPIDDDQYLIIVVTMDGK
ncbi:hypothetical protein GM708_17715 [Vibrio cholerae]|nr:hypothetical protein [Vibrio cholerae]